MKKFLVIGNPIEHSLSPKLHNYWIKSNNLKAVYDKKKLDISELENLIKEVKEKKIDGINVTVPFKNSVIPFLDKLSNEAQKTQSVNTIYLRDGMVIGHNTDIEGFELAIKNTNYDIVEIADISKGVKSPEWQEYNPSHPFKDKALTLLCDNLYDRVLLNQLGV